MPATDALTPPVPIVSTGTTSAAASWRRWAAAPTGGSELGQTIGQPTQCLGRLAWWQENEIVDVASEPLTLLQRRRQVGQVGGFLQLFGREAVDRLEPSLARANPPGERRSSTSTSRRGRQRRTVSTAPSSTACSWPSTSILMKPTSSP